MSKKEIPFIIAITVLAVGFLTYMVYIPVDVANLNAPDYNVEDSLEANIKNLSIEQKKNIMSTNPKIKNLDIPEELVHVVYLSWNTEDKELKDKLNTLENKIIAEKGVPTEKVWKLKHILFK